MIIEGEAVGRSAPALRRVPTPVRDLLPQKPYVPPEPTNPLPGAVTEPDCCSICLLDFEPQEKVRFEDAMHQTYVVVVALLFTS